MSALPHLTALRRSGALADVAIRVDGAAHPLPAHAAILAAASGYFYALLAGAGAEMGGGLEVGTAAPLRSVSLTGLPRAGVDAALDFAYSGGHTTPSADVAAAALRVADYLDMPALARAAAATLKSALTPSTALDALGLAATCGAEAGDLYDAALRLAHARFDEVVALPSLMTLPPAALLALLTGDGAAAACEDDVLKAGAAWLAAAPAERARHAPAVVAAVRVDPRVLLAAPGTEVLLATLPPAAATALRVALADAAAVPRGGTGPPPPPRARRGGAALVAAGGHDDGWRPFRTAEAYVAADDAWAPAPRAPAPLPFAAAAPAAGVGRCYVVAGAATRATALVLERDAEAVAPHSLGLKWRSLPPPTVARIHAAAAALGDDLFVAGGRPGVGPELASVELWRPGLSRWTPAPALTSPRTAAAAAAVGGRVYVIGGQTGKTTHGGGEWLDAGGGGRWLPLGPRSQLATPRKYATAVEWGGRLVLLGGTDALRARLASVEAFDPRDGRWLSLPSLSLARSGAGAAVAAGGALIVAGGTPSGGDGAVDAVEVLRPGGGGGSGWCAGPPLGAPRAGLALLAV